MVSYTPIDENFAIAPQIVSEEIKEVQEAGFKTIINFRPDDEFGDYMKSSEARKIAEGIGLHYVHIPISSVGISTDQVDEVRDLLNKDVGPLFAHCASGRRASILWGMAQAGQRPVPEILELTLKAGQDLSDFADDFSD